MKKNRQICKEINQLAIPGILSTIVNTIFTIADEAIVGHIDIEGYAAVGIASGFLYLIIGNLGALSTAFVILFSNRIGKADKKAQNSIFNSAMTIAIIVGIIFALLFWILGKPFLAGIYGISGKTLEDAYVYLEIASLGIGLNVVGFIFSGFFRNLLKAKVSLIAICISLPVNFIFDFVLVFGKMGFPQMGCAGAAIGTVLGLASEIVVYILFFIKENYFTFHFKIDKEDLRELIKIYIPIFGQDFVETTLFSTIIGALISRYSILLFASYTLINAFINAFCTPIYSYAAASMTLVGQCFGEDKRLSDKYPKFSILCTVPFLIIGVVLVALFPNRICGLITNQNSLIDTAASTIVLALCIQFINIPCQVYKYTLQAIGEEKWIFAMSILLSMISCFIIFIFLYVLKLNLVGVFSGFGIMYIYMTLFFKKKYKIAKET